MPRWLSFRASSVLLEDSSCPEVPHIHAPRRVNIRVQNSGYFYTSTNLLIPYKELLYPKHSHIHTDEQMTDLIFLHLT